MKTPSTHPHAIESQDVNSAKDGSPDGNEHPPPDSNIDTSMTCEIRPLANSANSTGVQAEIEEKDE